ncbi:MAG: hypothetical protein OXF54_20790 [Caldilineaceae bacterium]|nr:hypothetical protein [Caldilineaceae bacterium]
MVATRGIREFTPILGCAGLVEEIDAVSRDVYDLEQFPLYDGVGSAAAARCGNGLFSQ